MISGNAALAHLPALQAFLLFILKKGTALLVTRYPTLSLMCGSFSLAAWVEVFYFNGLFCKPFCLFPLLCSNQAAQNLQSQRSCVCFLTFFKPIFLHLTSLVWMKVFLLPLNVCVSATVFFSAVAEWICSGILLINSPLFDVLLHFASSPLIKIFSSLCKSLESASHSSKLSPWSTSSVFLKFLPLLFSTKSAG